jgi:hypothetical protein
MRTETGGIQAESRLGRREDEGVERSSQTKPMQITVAQRRAKVVKKKVEENEEVWVHITYIFILA